jgi:hypothetical protein
MQYSIELREEAGGRWIAEIPALPGIVAYGVNCVEARRKVQTLALRALAERLEHPDAASDLISVSFHERKKYDLGILLVHGIGTQRSGETLTRWADVLLKTIRRATGNAVVPSIGPADAGRDGCAEAVASLGMGDQQQQWLLSERWWADAFVPPRYSELVSWSVRALPWSIALHIAQKFWQEPEVEGSLAKFAGGTLAVVKLLGALLFAPIFVLFLMLASLLGLLPIAQLRARILALQGSLVGSVGDSLAFIESPIRAALIRTRVIDGLKRLKERCKKTIVVAHSQGAAIVLDALGGIPEPPMEDGQQVQEAASASDAVPDTLLTFGAGTNPLAGLKVLSAGDASRTGKNALWPVLAFFYIVIGLSVWLFIIHAPFWAILLSGTVLFLSGIVCSLILLAVTSLIPILASRWSSVRKHQKAITTWIFVLLTSVLVVMGIVFWRYVPRSIPLGWVAFLVSALILLGAAISGFFSKQTRTVVTIVRKPPGLCRWIDLYASADPVPNGKTLTMKNVEGVTDAIQISNLGSIFGDHTAYWDNLDEFVLRVVKECAETGNSPWKARLPQDTSGVQERAAWRVRWLQLARLTVTMTWLAVGGIVWHRPERFGPDGLKLPFGLYRWIPSWLKAIANEVPAAVLGILIVLAILGTFVLLGLPWRHWVRLEQKTVLDQKPLRGGGFYPLVGMGIVVWCLFALVLVVAVVAKDGLSGLRVLADATNFALAAFWIYVLSRCSTWLLLRLSPAPSVPRSNK